MMAVTIVPCARVTLIEDMSAQRKVGGFYLYYMRARDIGDMSEHFYDFKIQSTSG